jgi:CheY-like chemotaxis protein
VIDFFWGTGKEIMRRILVVDNYRDMCGIISEILRDENNEVNIAYDGNAALARIKKKLMTC